MIRVVSARKCPVCGRRDWHIHPNSDYEKVAEAQKAQLKLW